MDVPALAFDASLTIGSNFPGASATGKMAINNGDYFLAASAEKDSDGYESGSVMGPRGNPNDTLRLYAVANLSNDGALSETIINFYDQVGGPVPASSENVPDAAPDGNAQGDFSGQWSSSYTLSAFSNMR